jgi:DNA-binding beta-propeller fold protein YncE
MRNRQTILALALLLIGINACAPGPSKRQLELVWPLPPDQPKIKFVDIIRTNLDLEKKGGLAEAIFGEERAEGFQKPYGVAVDKDGKIYVTDINRVFVLDLKKKDYDFIGNEPGVGQLRNAIGIAIASDGRVFVTDVSAARLYVYRNGKYAEAIGEKGEFASPSGVALDEKNGLIYVTDTRYHTVKIFSLLDYKHIRDIGKNGSGIGEFNFPTNIAVDAEGKFYVVDTGNFRVQIFGKDGQFIRAIGVPGDMPGSFARPKGIAIDSEEHIYVVDTAFQNFQIFDQTGKILLAVGSGGTDPGQFLLPAGMTIDDQDKIYVVNQIPGTVQIFQYLGEKWKEKMEQTGEAADKK